MGLEMFKEIASNLKKLVSRETVAVDPSKFGDPIAEATKWSPLKKGGASFCTHKLIDKGLQRMEFCASIGMKLFAGIFFIIGLGSFVGFFVHLASAETIGLNADTIITPLFGIVFTGAGACMFYFMARPGVFDKNSGYFWKGWKGPNQVVNKAAIKDLVELEQIHGLQLISEYCSGNKSSYYSYELNLVLENGERVNVIDHGGLEKIRADAARLSDFLGKPVWDAT